MKDNLEDFFNKHLNDEDNSSGDSHWNTPSDDVWAKASPQFQKVKRNKRFLYLWLAVGALFIGMSVLSQYIIKLESKVHDISDTAIKNKIEQKIAKELPSHFQNEEILEKRINEIASPSNQNIHNQKSKNHIERKYLDTHDAIYIEKPETYPNHLINYPSKIEIPKLKNQDRINIDIDKLPQNGLNRIEKEDFDIKATFHAPIKQVSKEKLGLWELEVFYGPTQIRTTLSNKDASKNDIRKSNNFGIGIGYKILPNLSITSGLSYRKVISNYHGNTVMPYDKTTEYLNEKGQMENKIPMLVSSSFGEIQTMNTITHPLGAQVEDKMDVSMDAFQTIQYFSIPLGLKYKWILSKHFNAVFSTGVALNQPISHIIKSKMSINSNTMEMTNSRVVSFEEVKTILWTYELGLGIQYNIFENLSVFSKASYFQNINSIYSHDGIDTGLQGLDLKLGLNLQF